jgi:disease resistance protein RPM1
MQAGAKKNIKFLTRELESMHAALHNVGDVPGAAQRAGQDLGERCKGGVLRHGGHIVDTFLVRVQGPEEPSKSSTKRFVKRMKNVFTKAPDSA